ncbi:CRISPR-associated endonuclease Cas1 [Succinimonas amylolytica]|uniref:CRISPR-associated endonuclease Cas1 n=1 Tax=Succinimonas amylolytica TaxID=83769 RepID=UPI003CCBF7A2
MPFCLITSSPPSGLYGLSEWLGFLHSERSGKPALALDLMEEFRAPVVDALIISIVRNRLFTVADFTEEYNDRNEKICLLNESSRKKFITLFQRRLDTFCTHRYSGKRLSWREIIYQQAGILLKTLKGELNSYIGMEY